MSRTPLSFCVEDISTLARNLRRQLENIDHHPTHVEMLNLLVKAYGFKNFQHFKSQQDPHQARELDQRTTTPTPDPIDYKKVKRTVRFFNAEGLLIRWPKKFSQRVLCLWIMWSRIPTKTTFTEREISDIIEKNHLFDDYALLRREMVDRGMISRTDDCSEYRRIEKKPPVEAIELLKTIRPANQPIA
ncbi:MAG: DUF2087 domain-containing protein [Desulfovibrio sp.]